MQHAQVVSAKKRNVSERLPRDFPWKVMGALAEGLSGSLPTECNRKLLGALRARSQFAYYALADEWSPQSIAHTGLSVEQFHAKYQAAAFLKKYQFPGDAESRRDVAISGFLSAEAVCDEVNSSDRFGRNLSLNSALAEALPHMREFCSLVLGNLVDLQSVEDNARHGPGSSLCTTKGRVTKYFKYSDLPYTVTASSRAYAKSLIQGDERWFGALSEEYRDRHGIPYHYPISVDHMFEEFLHVVPGNKITFVPKDGRKDRPIAIEPRMNLFLQLGVDGFIRKRLKSWGCDLDYQGKNQRFAMLGSTHRDDRRFATIDLSAASDSVSLSLCHAILPSEWFAYLMDLRSPIGTVTGKGLAPFSLRYEKLSSMGNGYTFAVESLVFLAVCYAALKISQSPYSIKHDVAVFGDDIVVPQHVALLVIELLGSCGFTTNVEKTFVTGKFKESCGKDFFHGVLVRPLSFSDPVSDIKELFALRNRCRHMSDVFSHEGLCPSFDEAVRYIDTLIPRKWLKVVGPPSSEEFDSYLHVTRDEARQSGLLKSRGWVYHFTRLVTKPVEKQGKKFLFRKLMADLRQSSSCRYSSKVWDPTVTGGSVFTVTERNALAVLAVSTSSSIWGSDYGDPVYFEPRHRRNRLS